MYTTWAFHPPLPGYEFSDIIGQGGYGVVKLARQLATGRDVAVKIFLQERRASSSGSVAREASLMRSLQHPHILQLLEEQQQGRFVFLVMELASRGTLECYVHEQGGLGEQEASLLFAQILSAMEYCHTSCIAHRDIKPGNILLDSNMHVKLADFGLSCRLPKGTRIRGFHGTPEYCAPETFSGEEYDAFLADMWSVGVTLFEMVTATLPFTGDTAEELQNRIVAGGYVLPRSCSPALTELLGFLLSVEAWARFTAHIARTHWWFGSCAQEPQDSPVPREDSVTLLELLSVPQDLKDRQYLSELGLLPGSTAQGTPEPAAHKSGCQPPCFLPSAGSHGAQDSLHLSSFHSDSVCFTPSSSTASLSSEPSGQLQEEQSSVSSASHEPVPEASCSVASTSSPTDLAEPEVEAPREPENTGTPMPAKEGKRGFRGACRRFLKFLQRACCIRQDPDRGPGLRSRKVAPEDSAQSK